MTETSNGVEARSRRLLLWLIVATLLVTAAGAAAFYWRVQRDAGRSDYNSRRGSSGAFIPVELIRDTTGVARLSSFLNPSSDSLSQSLG